MTVRTSSEAVVRPAPTAAHARSATLAINEARALVDDLFAARPSLYWTDLLLTLAVAYPMGAIYLAATPFSLLQGISFLIAGFALFRAGSFIHEIAHMRGGQMLSFRIAWNLLCGIPFIMPSHLYENHVDHHNSHHYGTARDGEYLPLGAGPVRDIFWFFIQAPFFPLYIALRLLLSPITFVHPRLRTWVLEHMSSYVIHFHHRLTIPKTAPRRAWAALEVACSIRLAIMLGVVVIGVYPWGRLVQIYCLAVFTISLNHIRNLVAHRYRNTGAPMSHADQLADSVTITGGRFSTELFFPLGLRYHALHHLFPAIPFHNLGRAHRRLMDQLPADSPYRQTVVPSYWTAVGQLWSSARESSHAKSPLPA